MNKSIWCMLMGMCAVISGFAYAAEEPFSEEGAIEILHNLRSANSPRMVASLSPNPQMAINFLLSRATNISDERSKKSVVRKSMGKNRNDESDSEQDENQNKKPRPRTFYCFGCVLELVANYKDTNGDIIIPADVMEKANFGLKFAREAHFERNKAHKVAHEKEWRAMANGRIYYVCGHPLRVKRFKDFMNHLVKEHVQK